MTNFDVDIDTFTGRPVGLEHYVTPQHAGSHTPTR
jgi:hypothetical protein